MPPIVELNTVVKMMKRCALMLMLALLWGGANAVADSSLKVAPAADGLSTTVSVTPQQTPFGFLELVEAGTGRVVYTLNAGRFPPGQTYTVSKNIAVAPGRYKLRYREGLDLKLLGELKRPEASIPNWINPTRIVQRGQNLYILDSGLDVVETRPDHLNELTWNPVTGEPFAAKFVEIKDDVVSLTKKDGTNVAPKLTDLKPADQEIAKRLEKERQELIAERATKQSAIFKMDTRGVLDPGFGIGGKLSLEGYYGIRGFDIDPASGALYLPGGHQITVYDGTGRPTRQIIGGWDNDPHGPKCTPWTNTVVVGPGNRLYIPNVYQNIKVYDRTKKGFDGILYHLASIPGGIMLESAASADGVNALYVTSRPGVIQKYIDDGKSLKVSYRSSEADGLAQPTGSSASAGLIWVASHGPGPGPYWDSGGGGEVVLYYDDGQKLQLVSRFGTPGTAGDRLEFMNPSSASMTDDHLQLWVAEDGLANKEGPRGNARIRLFQQVSTHTEEVLVDVK